MTEAQQAKPTKFYIDFENVHGAGLKGVDELGEHDEVIVIYSQAAETFHIEHAIDILKSKARIEFVEVDGGTRNAADFQLIVALFGAMSEDFDYAIISGDGGFDAAIKMGERMGLPPVRRAANIRGDVEVEKAEKTKSRRTRRSRSGRDGARDGAEAEQPKRNEAPVPEDASHDNAKSAPTAADELDEKAENADPKAIVSAPDDQAADAAEAAEAAAGETPDRAEEQKTPPSRRRPRRRKRSSGAAGEQAEAAETASPKDDSIAVETAPATDDANSRGENVPAIGAGGDGSGTDAVGSSEGGEKPDTDQASETSRPSKTATAGKGARKKPAGSRRDTQEDTAAARARAAEAMKLALAENEAANERVNRFPAGNVTDDGPNGADEGAVARIKALLETRGVQLPDKQIATVASALEGPDGRQGFYRRIIKIERQQNGRTLYRQVREHYEALMEALRA